MGFNRFLISLPFVLTIVSSSSYAKSHCLPLFESKLSLEKIMTNILNDPNYEYVVTHLKTKLPSEEGLERIKPSSADKPEHNPVEELVSALLSMAVDKKAQTIRIETFQRGPKKDTIEVYFGLGFGNKSHLKVLPFLAMEPFSKEIYPSIILYVTNLIKRSIEANWKHKADSPWGKTIGVAMEMGPITRVLTLNFSFKNRGPNNKISGEFKANRLKANWSRRRVESPGTTLIIDLGPYKDFAAQDRKPSEFGI